MNETAFMLQFLIDPERAKDRQLTTAAKKLKFIYSFGGTVANIIRLKIPTLYFFNLNIFSQLLIATQNPHKSMLPDDSSEIVFHQWQ